MPRHGRVDERRRVRRRRTGRRAARSRPAATTPCDAGLRRRSTSRRRHGRRRHGRSPSVRRTAPRSGSARSFNSGLDVSFGQAFVGDRPVGPVEAGVEVEPGPSGTSPPAPTPGAATSTGSLAERVSRPDRALLTAGDRPAEPLRRRRGGSRRCHGDVGRTRRSPPRRTRRSPTPRCRVATTPRPRSRSSHRNAAVANAAASGACRYRATGVQRPHRALVVDDGVGDDVVMVMMRIQRPARAMHERRGQQSLGVDDPTAAAGDRGDAVEMADRGAVGRHRGPSTNRCWRTPDDSNATTEIDFSTVRVQSKPTRATGGSRRAANSATSPRRIR